MEDTAVALFHTECGERKLIAISLYTSFLLVFAFSHYPMTESEKDDLRTYDIVHLENGQELEIETALFL